MTDQGNQQALDWQINIWNRMSDVYSREIDQRFAPVIAGAIERAGLTPGDRLLDLGTGTGAVAALASPLVGAAGAVIAVDISPAMLEIARSRFDALGLANVSVREGRAEEIPAEDGAFDVVIASLSLMFALDKNAAAHELACVLRPGGRFVAAVWSGPDRSDFIRLQQMAASFGPEPPVPGTGPGALGNPQPFLAQLTEAGIDATADELDVVFEFAGFDDAWTTFAGVTATRLTPEQQEQAKTAIRTALYPDGDGARLYRNVAIFLTGTKRD
jgi:ubiquinone/menaquinone biosynthesis C-methylase UbiE